MKSEAKYQILNVDASSLAMAQIIETLRDFFEDNPQFRSQHLAISAMAFAAAQKSIAANSGTDFFATVSEFYKFVKIGH